MRSRSIAFAALLAASVSFAQNPVRIKLDQWATGITRVTDIAHCGDSRLFVTQQSGIIKIITDSNTVLPTPFLNMQSVVNDGSNEQGLLGLVFDPDYATNGFFYTHYTGGSGNGMSVISRWSVSTGDPNVADASSEDVLYTWPQPAWNHNGGDIDFGPDGHLYASFGDGGGGDDTYDNAGDYTDPLAAMIRIDVSDTSVAYTIPPTNPYATSGPDTLPEIWAEGLRNPYRFGFDRLTGDLWIGDVGQNAWEEVDFWPAGDNSGPNFGWHCREGLVACPGCNTSGCGPASAYVSPVVVHANIANSGSWCSSIGGRVYRGTEWPHLYGHYFYTDYCGSEFRYLTPDGSGGFTDAQACTSLSGYTVIAENADGELFAGNNDNGRVYRIKDKCPMDPPAIAYTNDTLTSTAANSYTWYFNGASLPGSNSPTWVPTQSGAYHVVGNFGNGCILNSDTLNVTVQGIAELMAPAVVLRPNPARDQVRISATAAGARQLRVNDAQGRTVHQAAFSNEAVLDLSRFARGQYSVQLLDAAGTVIATAPLGVVH